MFSFFRRNARKEESGKDGGKRGASDKNKPDAAAAAIQGAPRRDASTTDDHVARAADTESTAYDTMAPMAAARGKSKAKRKQHYKQQQQQQQPQQPQQPQPQGQPENNHTQQSRRQTKHAEQSHVTLNGACPSSESDSSRDRADKLQNTNDKKTPTLPMEIPQTTRGSVQGSLKSNTPDTQQIVQGSLLTNLSAKTILKQSNDGIKPPLNHQTTKPTPPQKPTNLQQIRSEFLEDAPTFLKCERRNDQNNHNSGSNNSQTSENTLKNTAKVNDTNQSTERNMKEVPVDTNSQKVTQNGLDAIPNPLQESNKLKDQNIMNDQPEKPINHQLQDKMETSPNQTLQTSPKLNISYANALRNCEDPVRKVMSVKPCSHVTLATSPRVPPLDADAAKIPAKTGDVHASVTGAIVSDSPSVPNKPAERPAANTEAPCGDLENEKRNLVNQEAKFQAQLADLSQKLAAREAETIKLQFQMEDLHRDLYVKGSGMDRLQAELQAAHKDSESVRQKLKHLQDDIAGFKQKNFELAEELQKKTEDYQLLETTSREKAEQLETTVNELTGRVNCLETQIENIKTEKDRIEQQRASIEAEREEEKKIVQEALEAAMEEKEQIQKRWEKDFEKLRTVNTDREQQMLDDFEWKLREVEQSCKKRLEEKERKTDELIKEARKDIENRVKVAEQQLNEVIHLKSYEAEVTQLRGLTHDQQKSLQVMLKQTEELQLTEQNMKDEISRLHILIENEKENQSALRRRHEKDLVDRERALQIRLEEQKGEVAVQWEQKLRQECARLKGELEQLHDEEKQLAAELVKVQKEQEYMESKKHWEQKLQECLNEIADLKKTIHKKDEKYQNDVERLQTNTDRDIFELRRAIDKTEMLYHDRMEKMLKDHENEIERLNEEADRRVKELETNCQMQVTSMRATLELVKEQMERESQNKIIALTEEHRAELERQWEKLSEEKSKSTQLIEKEYRSKYEKLKDQFMQLQKNHTTKESELLKIIENLKVEVQDKCTVITDLQNNVDTLHGGIQVLNQELASQDQKSQKVMTEAEQKVCELQQILKKERAQLQMEREEHIEEITHMQKQSQSVVEQLQRKCQCLTKLFEDMRLRYDNRESRQEDLDTITDLRNVIAEQERDLQLLNEEKRFFQLELMKRQSECNQTLNRYTTKEDLSLNDHMWKGGTQPPHKITVIKSKSVEINGVKKQDGALASSLPT